MTIKDIARECGCAIGTVSRVLNNHPDVSESTRAKVMAVVEKHGFVLNTNAKQLKSQERKTIVVLVKGTSSILLNALLERIQKKFEDLPYTVDVVVLDEYDNEAQQANRIYYERKPLGIIFLGGNPQIYQEDFAKTKIPCVLISNEAKNVENENISSVSIDNFDASYFLANYLIQNGHKNIGVIGGDLSSSDISQRRFEGFAAAIQEAEFRFDLKKDFVTSKYSFEGGAEAAKKLITQNPEITAIFTMSDVMAMGAIRQLKDMGYSVPEDISIVGFDGISLADYYCPRITTIKQPEGDLVEKGLNLLLDCIEKKSDPSHLHISFEFIKGESVKHI